MDLPRAVGVVLALVFFAFGAACGGGPGTPATGPLAIYAGEWNEDNGAVVGTLVLEGRCVYLDQPAQTAAAVDGGEIRVAAQRWFLLFGAEGTAWDAEPPAVRIGRREYRVGTVVRFGGGVFSERSSPGDFAQLNWRVPPDPSCDVGDTWIVARPD